MEATSNIKTSKKGLLLVALLFAIFALLSICAPYAIAAQGTDSSVTSPSSRDLKNGSVDAHAAIGKQSSTTAIPAGSGGMDGTSGAQATVTTQTSSLDKVPSTEISPAGHAEEAEKPNLASTSEFDLPETDAINCVTMSDVTDGDTPDDLEDEEPKYVEVTYPNEEPTEDEEADWILEYEPNYPNGAQPTGVSKQEARHLTKKGVATVDSCAYSCAGYEFKYWTMTPEDMGEQYIAGSLVQFVSEPYVLYAQWGKGKAEICEISFFANYPDLLSGFGGEQPDVTLVAADDPVVPACAFTCSGYEFSHWTDDPEGLGTRYVAGEPFVSYTDRLNLYAQWVKVYAKFTFDAASGGEVFVETFDITRDSITIDIDPSNGNIVSGDLPLTDLLVIAKARPGFKFATWMTTGNEDAVDQLAREESELREPFFSLVASSINPETGMLVYGSVSFTAVFSPCSYEIIYDANGAEGFIPAQFFEFDTAETLLDAENANRLLTHAGYRFIGWNVVPNPTNDEPGIPFEAGSNADALVTSGLFDNAPDSHITLYAQWVREDEDDPSHPGEGNEENPGDDPTPGEGQNPGGSEENPSDNPQGDPADNDNKGEDPVFTPGDDFADKTDTGVDDSPVNDPVNVPDDNFVGTSVDEPVSQNPEKKPASKAPSTNKPAQAAASTDDDVPSAVPALVISTSGKGNAHGVTTVSATYYNESRDYSGQEQTDEAESPLAFADQIVTPEKAYADENSVTMNAGDFSAKAQTNDEGSNTAQTVILTIAGVAGVVCLVGVGASLAGSAHGAGAAGAAAASGSAGSATPTAPTGSNGAPVEVTPAEGAPAEGVPAGESPIEELPAEGESATTRGSRGTRRFFQD